MVLNLFAIIKECANNGLMVEGTGTYNNVIRFLAPLVITNEKILCGLDIFEKAINKCMSKWIYKMIKKLSVQNKW